MKFLSQRNSDWVIEIYRGFLCLFSIFILIETLLFCLQEHRFYVPKITLPLEAQSVGQQMQNPYQSVHIWRKEKIWWLIKKLILNETLGGKYWTPLWSWTKQEPNVSLFWQPFELEVFQSIYVWARICTGITIFIRIIINFLWFFWHAPEKRFESSAG